MELLSRLAEVFRDELDKLRRKLENTPHVLGLTYGVDRGRLIKLVMGNQVEYIGRPLNIAARLQGAVKERDKHADKNPAYKALISKPAFDELKIPSTFPLEHTTRNLRNIEFGENYECVELTVAKP